METNKINYNTIQHYLAGTLDKEAMHELERQALDDPFLADAIEGYTLSKMPAGRQLSLLQSQLDERIAQQRENKNRYSFSWQRLSIAAAAGLLFIIASILFWMKSQTGQRNSDSPLKEVEVKLNPEIADVIQNTEGTSAALTKTIPGVFNKLPEPEAGWTNYQKYLAERTALLSDNVEAGQVVLQFKVNRDKSLSEFKILDGLDPVSNREAIKLIKSGPAWIPGKEPKIEVTIQFKDSP